MGAQTIRARATGVLGEIRTRPLFAITLAVRPMLIVGDTPTTFRRIGVIFSGRFEGERLSGEVLDGGSDWQSVRRDGSALLDVRLTLKTEDGAVICMTYRGLRHGSADIIARIDRGEAVDPASYYFRINPMFETASEKYDWLNGILAIGVGHRFEDGPLYNVFEVL
jgi:hypothetical protein